LAQYYTLATGIDVTPKELEVTGERINNLARVFNIREGFSRKDDHMPAKVMSTPIPDEGVSKGSYVSQKELDLLLDDYYEIRGWTKDGIPTIEKLKEIGLDEFIPIVKPKIEKPKK
jgi:aldehyde:ferredoxin oxidoreductase